MSKIKRVCLHILEAKIHPVKYAQETNEIRDSAIIEIETDNGITGWGECFFNRASTPNTFSELCIKNLVGKEISNWKKIRKDLYIATIRDGPAFGLISGVEIALLDILGKESNLPINTFFGGLQREKVRLYATGCYRPDHWTNQNQIVEGMTKEVNRYIDLGFLTTKIKIGFNPKEDADIVNKLVKNVKNHIEVAVDANAKWNLQDALVFLRNLSVSNLAFFEEPFPSSDLDGYIELRKKTNFPIACGEGIRHIHTFRDFLQNKAVDIIQPDIIISGGYSMLSDVNAIATANNVRVIPHCWGSGISFIATAHFMSTLDGGIPWISHIHEPLMEYDQSENPLRDEILMEPLQVSNGYLFLPKKSGLGIEINRKKLEKYTVLSMGKRS